MQTTDNYWHFLESATNILIKTWYYFKITGLDEIPFFCIFQDQDFNVIKICIF